MGHQIVQASGLETASINFCTVQPGSLVNLERPLRVAGVDRGGLKIVTGVVCGGRKCDVDRTAFPAK